VPSIPPAVPRDLPWHLQRAVKDRLHFRPQVVAPRVEVIERIKNRTRTQGSRYGSRLTGVPIVRHAAILS
jgi:hypothetical protein